MQNHRAIAITGASSGIGTALALHYAASGVRLCLAGRDKSRLGAVAEQCRAKGATVTEALVDVTDAGAMERWLMAADDAGAIDLVIANAGISGGSGGGNIFAEPPEQVRRILSVNIGGVINTLTPIIPRMVDRGYGNIAIIASLAGMRGLPSAPAYSTSKAAVKAYGEALRGLLGSKGVSVSVVMPGYIETPMTEQNPFYMPFLMKPEKAARIIARGIERGKGRIAFPLPLYLPMLVVSNWLPSAWVDPLFARLPAKPAIGE
jgi:short-subunit dehydrogenase